MKRTLIVVTKEKDFEEAIKQHSNIISKVCYYYANDLDHFKDLRQEVLINIWNGWDQFNSESKLSTWFYRIAINTCVSQFRKSRRRGDKISLESLLNVPSDNDFDYSQLNEMHSLINRLDAQEKAIILLWLDETPYDTIGELTGLNRNTVASKLRRIKEKLIKFSDE